MTREELEEIRKAHDELLESKKEGKLEILKDSKVTTASKMGGVQALQLEELINSNLAILMELRYMNDKEHEVNNG